VFSRLALSPGESDFWSDLTVGLQKSGRVARAARLYRRGALGVAKFPEGECT
jgi:Flp pilus assembly protein TadD